MSDLKSTLSIPHVVNISGGKDSTACYLLALERRERTGMDFLAVTADTGHEHPLTYEYIRNLPTITGGPEVVVVKADFTARINKKRRTIENKWADAGISQKRIDQALELLMPTGNPFLDMCMLKGRFPSTRARFCTEELKAKPIEHILVNLIKQNKGVVSWQGERRDESRARANLEMFQKIPWYDPVGILLKYRPLVYKTATDVFAIHKHHGIEPNPLYKMGMGRVGCMPCIMCRKNELKEIAARFPNEIKRVAEWEKLVANASKTGLSTFFSADKTPYSQNQDGSYPSILDVAEWSKTDRGGRQFNLFTENDKDAFICSSLYGLCE